VASPRRREKRRCEDEDDDDYENDKRGRRSDALKSIRIVVKPEPPTSAPRPKSGYKTKLGPR
jgi:hypothetical protein